MLTMSITSDDLDWFIKYIEALPSDAKLSASDLDKFNLNISFTAEPNKTSTNVYQS